MRSPLSMRHAPREAPADPAAGASGPPPQRHPSARRRQGIVVAGTAVGVAALAGAGWLVQRGADRDAVEEGRPAAPRTQQAVVERQVGPARVVRLGDGRAKLRVSTETTAASASQAPARATAGVPLRLALELPPGAPVAGARLTARGRGDTLAPLSRPETVLLDRRSGELVLPGEPGTGGHGAHEPGAGLAQSVAGGGDRWAVTLPPRPDRVAVDPGGRFVAVAYARAARVELVDLLRQERAGAVRIGGRLGALRFAPGGRLWVADEAAGRVAVVDPVARRVLGAITTGAGRQAIAFDAGGRVALVTAGGSGRATLVDARRLVRIRAIAAPQATDVAFARAAGRFMVASSDGTLRAVGSPFARADAAERLSLGRDATAGAIAVAPDGRTGVVLLPSRDAVAVVDLERWRVRRIVRTGDAPGDAVFLGRFAIVRNARSAALTWIDTAEPSRAADLPLGRRPAAGLVAAADGRSALATVPGDRQVAVLHVMMGRPMIMDGIANRTGADLVASAATSLQRTGPRHLEQRAVFEQPGRYRLAVRLRDGARATFALNVAGRDAAAGRVVAERRRLAATTGTTVRVRFRVDGAAPGDAEVLALATSPAGGVRQVRAPARAAGDGVYEAALRVALPGTYRVTLLSHAQDLQTDERSGALLRVKPR